MKISRFCKPWARHYTHFLVVGQWETRFNWACRELWYLRNFPTETEREIDHQHESIGSNHILSRRLYILSHWHAKYTGNNKIHYIIAQKPLLRAGFVFILPRLINWYTRLKIQLLAEWLAIYIRFRLKNWRFSFSKFLMRKCARPKYVGLWQKLRKKFD